MAFRGTVTAQLGLFVFSAGLPALMARSTASWTWRSNQRRRLGHVDDLQPAADWAERGGPVDRAPTVRLAVSDPHVIDAGLDQTGAGRVCRFDQDLDGLAGKS